jgi:hypothetical protein
MITNKQAVKAGELVGYLAILALVLGLVFLEFC